MYSGKQKIKFCQRLGPDWRKLRDYFEIEDHLDTGDEPSALWEWLKRREALAQLPEALAYIGRDDLVVDILQPTDSATAETRPTWTDPPYPGLRHFTERDAPIFFGRGRETAELLDRLHHDPLVAVIGASGSGKSSLVAAGVIPHLHDIPGGETWRRLRRFTPGGLGDDPFLALAARLEPGLERQGLNTRAIADKLYQTGHLAALAEPYRDGGDPQAPLLVFIDQFEELFTLTRDEYRRRFLDTLVRAAHSPQLRIVLTLRADFYHRCVEHPRMAELLRSSSYPLAAPELPALLEMITGPAAVAGLDFEDGLPGRILRETGNEPGALALMAFALEELYLACRPGRTLTAAAYDSFGGVQGAIARRAEQAFGELDDATRTALGDVFKELVEVDPERGIPTRRRTPLARFASDSTARELIDHFDRARLLVLSDPDRTGPMIEVAHEALFTRWPRLHEWIEERFDDLRLLRQLRLEAGEWHRQGCPASHLWRHERLQPVYDMIDRLQPELPEIARAFIRPEAERLLDEIDDPATNHQRRAIIGDRLAEIGDPRPGVGLKDGLPDIDWVPVPGGEITLEDDAGTFPVEPFEIDRYPVTWAQYRCFLDAEDGYRNTHWWDGLAERQDQPGVQYRQLNNHPAENVNWYDAVAFSNWLSKRLGYEVRLPTEWEWQQAATGGDPSREFPWPGDWNGSRANTLHSGLSRTTAVGLYLQSASPVGSLDMAGNVEEWCLNEYEHPERTDLSGTGRRVVRGGSWNDPLDRARAAYRYLVFPDGRASYLGFRVVRRSLS